MTKVTQAEATQISDALRAIGRSSDTDYFDEVVNGQFVTTCAVTIRGRNAQTGNYAIAYVGSVAEIPAAIAKIGAKLSKTNAETLGLMAAERGVNAE